MDPRLLFRFAPDGAGGGAPPAADPPAAAPAAEPPAGPPTWLTQVSPDRRDRKELHKYARLNDLVDAHLDMESRLGRAIVVPDPAKATPEEVIAFKKGMGIPEKPEEYAFDAGKYKDVEGVDKLAETIRALAASRGLTKSQAAGVFDFIASQGKGAQEARAESRKTLRESFPARLLEAVGNDQKKLEEVQNRFTAFVTKELGDADLVKELADSGLLFSPRFAVRMAGIAAKMGDAPYIDGKGSASSSGPGMFGKAYSDDFAKAYGGKS